MIRHKVAEVQFQFRLRSLSAILLGSPQPSIAQSYDSLIRAFSFGVLWVDLLQIWKLVWNLRLSIPVKFPIQSRQIHEIVIWWILTEASPLNGLYASPWRLWNTQAAMPVHYRCDHCSIRCCIVPAWKGNGNLEGAGVWRLEGATIGVM